jgi:long-chain acyl-CoA synthetase
LLEEVQTLGELRKLVAGGDLGAADAEEELPAAPPPGNGLPPAPSRSEPAAQPSPAVTGAPAATGASPAAVPPALPRRRYLYPTWPWWKPVEWIRWGFIEALMRPFLWVLSNPRYVSSGKPLPSEPMIIISNHITSYDEPFLQCALPGPVRRRLAIAMSGDMLESFRNWRNPRSVRNPGGFSLFGPPSWFLLTALFNVFPLASRRDFQSSFAYAGKALDHGYNVVVFPEGALSPDGSTARFRPGIGLLVKQSSAPVLPMALRGLGELKTRKRHWFHSGSVEVWVGEPIRFGPEATEMEITTRLQAEVEKLVAGQGVRVNEEVSVG